MIANDILIAALFLIALVALIYAIRSGGCEHCAAEPEEADTEPLAVDRGVIAPVRGRLVHPDEAREQLLDGAVRRHPPTSLGGVSPHPVRGMSTPGAGVVVPAPGVVSNPQS